MDAKRAAVIRGMTALLLLAAVMCAASDTKVQYDAPDKESIKAFGSWAQSGNLLFRLVKTSEQDTIQTETGILKAPAGLRFFVLTVQVMPAESDKSSVDYVASTSLVASQGTGYAPSAERFLSVNGGSLPVVIEAGRFVERVVPFLISEDFTPIALRCIGGAGAEPSFLALRREG